MSDNVPLEIQEKIIKTLPIKSLIRFRSVSKTWKSLIDSSDFIDRYSSQQQHLLLVSYGGLTGYVQKYVSIAEDDAFPQRKVSLNPPLLVKMLKYCGIIGSSHGLLCLRGNYEDASARDTAVLWNLSIRKAVAVVLPDVGYGIYKNNLGFGVCPETKDPKIVKFTLIKRWTSAKRIPPIPWQIDVFTLRTGTWRSLFHSLPSTSVQLFGSQVIVDRFIYWLANDTFTEYDDDDYEPYTLIISFDLTSEQFREVHLPDSLAYNQNEDTLHISKLGKSLVVLEQDIDEMGISVWRMEDGFPESFTKLYYVDTPDATVHFVWELRKSGELVIQISKSDDEASPSSSQIVTYEPDLKHINYPVIDGFPGYVYSYTETLLLVDQPDFIIYDAKMGIYDASFGKRYISKPKDTDARFFKHTSNWIMEPEKLKAEPTDNVVGEKMDMMKKVDSKVVEEWLDLKRKKVELEQQRIDLKKKKMDMALLCADTTKMAPENLAVHQKLVAEILKNYG